MSMTTLLTLASMFGSLSSVTPRISYVTKLDVWMVVCIVFVFGSLLEFTIIVFIKNYFADVSYLMDSIPRATSSVSSKIAWIGPESDATKDGKASPKKASPAKAEKVPDNDRKADALVAKIERISVVGFPSLFLIFNIGYWVDLLSVYLN